jgi:hypothetical protein
MKKFFYSFLALGVFLLGNGLIMAISPSEGEIETIYFFPDLDANTIEGQAAANLRERGIIQGRPDGNFDGTASVNRAEIAKFLMLARGVDVGNLMNNGKFPDVREGEWYVPYVMKAHQLEILNGYPSGNFDPARSVNTVEFLKMAVKTFGLAENLPHNYTDVPPGEWFAPYVGVAKEYELFPHRSETLLEPDRTLTRNEVAVAIYRIIRPKGYDDIVEGDAGWMLGNTTNINAKTTNTLPIIAKIYSGKPNLEVMSLLLVPSHNVTLKKLVFDTQDKNFFSAVWLKDSANKLNGNVQTVTLDFNEPLQANQSKNFSIYADTTSGKNNGDSATLTLKSLSWETNGKVETKNVSVAGYQIMITDENQ